MQNSEEIVTRFGHPIIRNRILQLSGCVPLDQSSLTLLSNLIGDSCETIPDLDGFYYKIYFPNKFESLDEIELNCIINNLSNPNTNINGTNILSNHERATLIIEVYHENISKFWNDGFQLVQYYKDIINMDINLLESQRNNCDHIKICVPAELISKIYDRYPRVMRTSAFFAFEMLTSAIRILLYCSNTLNTIRYISYFWNNKQVSERNPHKVDSYTFFETSEFSGKKLHTYYPNKSSENSNILIAMELSNPLIEKGILTNNFLKELSMAVNQFEYNLKKKEGEKIHFFFSKYIPKNINEIEILATPNSEQNSLFLIITVPVSWLHSTNDSKKLFLATFISTIGDLLYQVIPQCRCLLRCGLRKHIMELTIQESKGY
ncbi:hypothetical protein FG386_002516 [Cryptosporidium ryanae]|uniref:uncharacterized protein n=1 Tax=Cryptosporidium ryanae TaxID=515981 RepID=UPI00351A1C3A|nr:hypothetical protein FG386_002516 [Cryptosporidium ryanae]